MKLNDSWNSLNNNSIQARTKARATHQKEDLNYDVRKRSNEVTKEQVKEMMKEAYEAAGEYPVAGYYDSIVIDNKTGSIRVHEGRPDHWIDGVTTAYGVQSRPGNIPKDELDDADEVWGRIQDWVKNHEEQ